jgi:hypothetical protein
MQEQAVATIFSARSFKATSSGHGCADVVAGLPFCTGVVDGLATRLILATGAVIVDVVNSVTVEVETTVVSVGTVLSVASKLCLIVFIDMAWTD